MESKSKIAAAMQTWLESQDDQEQILMISAGQQYTAAQLIVEVNDQTDLGKKLELSITELTIDLLFRKKEGPLDAYDKSPSLERWEELYTPLDFKNEGQGTFMPYAEALARAEKFNPDNPQFHIWTRRDADESDDLLLNNGVQWNNIDFCVCLSPWGTDPDGDIYIEVVHYDSSERED